MPNYYVTSGYFINWSEYAVARMKTLTIANRKLEEGRAHEIKDNDDKKLASALRNQSFWFQNNISFAPTGQYSPTFRMGLSTIFQNTSSNISVEESKQLQILGILCSRFAKYIFKNFLNHTVHTQEGDLVNFILPIEINPKIDALVQQIINKQKKNAKYDYASLEQIEIDRLVYEMYGLTEEDIAEVESWYARRYPKLVLAQRENLKRNKKIDLNQ